MKAGVFTGNRQFRIEEVPYPALEPDGVIVRVKSSGICGSDLHLYRHAKGQEMIFGHEFSGDIVEFGRKVTGVKEGERVAVMSGRGCGECYWCRKGDILRCSRLQLLGYGVQGAMAEFVSVPVFGFGAYSAILPEGVNYDVGATAEPLSVALYAVNQMQPQPGDRIVVIGLGIIGLCIIQILKARGVTDVIASGRRANRLDLARRGGARVVIDAAVENSLTRLKEAVSDRRADIVFEVAGNAESFQQSLEIVRRGGRIDIIGLYEQPVNWNPGYIAMHDITLVGCGLRWDIPGAVKLIEDGQVDTQPYITHVFPLEKIKEAYDAQLEDKGAIKVIVRP